MKKSDLDRSFFEPAKTNGIPTHTKLQIITISCLIEKNGHCLVKFQKVVLILNIHMFFSVLLQKNV